MAVGAAVLKYITDHKLVERCATMGRYLLKHLQDLKDIDIVGDVRGLGLFTGVEFVTDKSLKTTFGPQIKLHKQIAREAFQRGLITYPGGGGADGVCGDHILLSPPFVITKAQIDDLVTILRDSILAVRKRLPPHSDDIASSTQEVQAPH
jgi:4-aminobutyrate aminotransferase-like enzyme